LTGLAPENAEAWRIYRLVASRFAADLHAGGVVLERITADLDPEAFEDLIQRLRILYEVLCPPTTPSEN
jgi:hypothetical protein